MAALAVVTDAATVEMLEARDESATVLAVVSV
jgi:hypothetical protein